MEIKELIREKMFAEIIAERDGIILNQHHQIETLQEEIKKLTASKEA